MGASQIKYDNGSSTMTLNTRALREYKVPTNREVGTTVFVDIPFLASQLEHEKV